MLTCGQALRASCAGTSPCWSGRSPSWSREGVELSLLANCSAQTIAKLVVVD
jgi:hypothetical protein